MDWNNDGKKDLITGEYNGNVRIYLNTGTDADPVFSGHNLLQVNGSTFDAGYYSMPYIVDWNEDGKKDVICGENAGDIQLLINTGTDASPVFTSIVRVQDGGSNLDVGSRSSPVSADWNDDGKKDLLVGETYGSIKYYENTGTNANPAFNGSVSLTAGGSPIDVGYYPRFEVADWDNDGTPDLLSGFYDYYNDPKAGVYYFHAAGGVDSLTTDVNTISQAFGGDVIFYMDAGLAYGGREYFLLGTASGTSPGTALPGGAVLPLNRDAVMNYIIAHYNTPELYEFRGTMYNTGVAKAMLSVSGSIPLPVGTVLNFAFTTENPYDFQSNAVSVEIVN